MWGGQDPYQRILMGPGDNPRYEAMLRDQQMALMSRGVVSQYRPSVGYPPLEMDPRGFRALTGTSEISSVPTLNMAVQDFSGTCVMPKPKKKVAKKAICGPALSDLNWPLDHYNNFVVSEGRLTEIKGSPERQAIVPVKKAAKPKMKALVWDQQAGDTQIVPAAKKKPKKLTTDADGQLVQIKAAKKKADSTISQIPAEKKKKPANLALDKSAVAATDIVSAAGQKKPRKRKASEEQNGFQQELQGEVRYTFKMTDTGTKKKASIKTMMTPGKEKKKSPAKKPAPKKPKTEEVKETSAASAASPVKAKPKQSGPPRNAQRWTVTQVVDFVGSLPGCKTDSKVFRSQAIDGKAFLMLKSEHLTGLGIKMGPAMKIYASILKLNQDLHDNPPPVRKAKPN